MVDIVERFFIRPAIEADAQALASLRLQLWPDATLEEHLREATALLSGKGMGPLSCAVFVAEDPAGHLIGFIETGLRSHAEGCDPSRPVGYVEGWFVAAECRRMGVGAALLAEAEIWARTQGCAEMASDTWLDNLASQRTHEALGFEEADRCVHYRKSLMA